MKVKIYVNTDEYGPSDLFPRVLTEKQYQEKIEELVKDRMKDLKNDDEFVDYLNDQDYTESEIFFLSEEERAKIIKDFEPFARDSVIDEMQGYYEEHEIEI